MSATPRLGFPFIDAGQAQKELLHNEALQLLDIGVAATVEQPPLDTPPQSPAPGDCFIVAPAAIGDWAGKDNCLAGYSVGGWRYLAPVEGMAAFVRSSDLYAVYRSGSWEVGIIRASSIRVADHQVVGNRAAAIASPTGGSTIDAEGRAAITQILAAMRHHGLIDM